MGEQSEWLIDIDGRTYDLRVEKRYIQPLMTKDYRASRDTLHDSLYAALQYLNQACRVIESCTPTFDEQCETVNTCRREIIACIKEIAR